LQNFNRKIRQKTGALSEVFSVKLLAFICMFRQLPLQYAIQTRSVSRYQSQWRKKM